jgi:hypothetical protein
VIDRSFILSYPEVLMEIKEFEFRDRAGKQIKERKFWSLPVKDPGETINNDKGRSVKERILSALRRISSNSRF